MDKRIEIICHPSVGLKDCTHHLLEKEVNNVSIIKAQLTPQLPEEVVAKLIEKDIINPFLELKDGQQKRRERRLLNRRNKL